MVSPTADDVDAAVAALYATQYDRLVRTAALMLRNRPVAEEVVQDAFVGLIRGWSRLRDPDSATAYLRRATVNGVRSVARRAGTVAKVSGSTHDAQSYADPAAGVVDRAAVLSALSALPERQREVLVLRYYADLDEAHIADALGISRGSVKTHASRGLAALRSTLEHTR